MEGITYSEEIIGIDANVLYKHLLVEKKEMKEIRSYVHIVLSKLIKIVNQLNRKSPQLKKEILSLIIEEIANSLRIVIQKHHRSLDYREIQQIWVELEFYQQFVSKYKVQNIEKCFYNLKKIYSKNKGVTKLATEAEIFSKEIQESKAALLNKEFVKVKLMQGCLE